jgi:methionyl-tRNA formyltransferase
MKIIFFGTPEFAVAHLQALVEAKIVPCAIVTRPDRPQGRSRTPEPPPLKAWAASHLANVPIFQPERCSTPEFAAILKQFGADLFVVVAYGEIIRQFILDLPPFGVINVHASLLPKYRGAAPMRHTLINGDSEAGISIIQLVLKMDAGDILRTKKMPVPDTMTYPELEGHLKILGSQALLEVMCDIEKGTVTRSPQDPSLVTLAPKITPEQCRIDWARPARDLHNLVRAMTPHPGAFCDLFIRGSKKRLKILRASFSAHAPLPPSTLVPAGKPELSVACGDGVLHLLEIQLEGKTPMTAEEFLRGYPLDVLAFTEQK